MRGGAKQVLLKKGKGRLPRSPQPSPDRGERKRGFRRLPAGCWPSAVTFDSVPPGKKEGGVSPACKKGPFTHPQLEDIWLSSSKSCLLGGQGPPAAWGCFGGSSVRGRCRCTEGTWDAPAPRPCSCAGGRQRGLCRPWRWAGVGRCSTSVQLLWVSFLC